MNLNCFYLAFLGLSNLLSNSYREKITQFAKLAIHED
jgi:hypothetical protein